LTEAPGLHRRAIDLGPGRQRADQVGDGPPAEALDASAHQLPEDRRRGLCVAESGVDGLDLDLQRLDQAGKPRGLAAGQLEDEPAERGRVDDRVLERPGEAPAQDPGVEGVMAVLDQDGSPGEMEEGAAGVTELGRVDEHLPLDQVPSLRVGVDRRPGVNQGVEEAQGPTQPEPLGADLEDEEGPVAGGLDVDCDELGHLQRRLRAHRLEVVATFDRLPGDQLGRPPGLEPEPAVVGFRHGLPS
jgi:hypothetical protein